LMQNRVTLKTPSKRVMAWFRKLSLKVEAPYWGSGAGTSDFTSVLW
jgi:hypothetical protein